MAGFVFVPVASPLHARDLREDQLGNHLVMVRGHHEGRLRQWWRTMIALTAS